MTDALLVLDGMKTKKMDWIVAPLFFVKV